MKFKTRYRTASLLIRVLFIGIIALGIAQAAKADPGHGTTAERTSAVRPQLPADGEVPAGAENQEWHPNWNITGKWVQTKLIVSQKAVVLNCDDNAYACARIERVMDHPLVAGRCTIYMPEYEGYPKAKPPTNWFWLLGKEKAHCDFGYYHD